MSDKGLYPKYFVKKLVDPENKHDNCFFLVIDLVHDRNAARVAEAYADLIEGENPEFARDLRDWMRENETKSTTS